jgi:hypothetical protein
LLGDAVTQQPRVTASPFGAAVARDVPQFPTLDDLKEWLGLDQADATDDAVLTVALNAAIAAQAMVVTYPTEYGTTVPILTDDLTNALYLRAQRSPPAATAPKASSGSPTRPATSSPPVSRQAITTSSGWKAHT